MRKGPLFSVELTTDSFGRKGLFPLKSDYFYDETRGIERR